MTMSSFMHNLSSSISYFQAKIERESSSSQQTLETAAAVEVAEREAIFSQVSKMTEKKTITRPTTHRNTALHTTTHARLIACGKRRATKVTEIGRPPRYLRVRRSTVRINRQARDRMRIVKKRSNIY
jgi:hypothetical protein